MDDTGADSTTCYSSRIRGLQRQPHNSGGLDSITAHDSWMYVTRRVPIQYKEWTPLG